ncbi:hypothetical protein GCM10017673_36720 [Streptosporangium violaceochromogenes]|nr:hypothetical protein GCM10017673_36720 [Streptosporangium violaceochromogenes]
MGGGRPSERERGRRKTAGDRRRPGGAVERWGVQWGMSQSSGAEAVRVMEKATME